MLDLDPAKLLVIAVVAVILLGPDKLPQVARQAGAAWRSFNEFRQRMENEVRASVPDLPSSHEISRLARSPSALLNHLSTKVDDSPHDTSSTPVSSSPEASPLLPDLNDASRAVAPPSDAPLPIEIVAIDPTLN